MWKIHTKSLVKDPTIMHPSTLFAGEDYKEPSGPSTQLHNLHMHVLRRLKLPVLTIISTMLAFVSQTSQETYSLVEIY